MKYIVTKGGLRQEIEEHMDNIGGVLRELSAEWRGLLLARKWVEILEEEG